MKRCLLTLVAMLLGYCLSAEGSSFLNHTYLTSQVWGGVASITITDKLFVESKFDYNEGQKPYEHIQKVYTYEVVNRNGLSVFSLRDVDTGKKETRNLLVSDLLLLDMDEGESYSRDNFFVSNSEGTLFIKHIATDDFSSVLTEGTTIYQMTEYDSSGGVRFNFVPWVENAKGDGIGEAFVFRPTENEKERDSYFVFVNGYASRKAPELFTENSRIRQLRLDVIDARDKVLETRVVDLRDTMEPQEVGYAVPGATEKLKFTILSVYHGSRFQDTCLSWCTLAFHKWKRD